MGRPSDASRTVTVLCGVDERSGCPCKLRSRQAVRRGRAGPSATRSCRARARADA
jgi:hypothetical protein